MSVRNDPCPCGSGRKYRKCCRLSSTLRNPSPVNVPQSANLCGDCKWWHSLGRDPMNLTAPENGQCRRMPPNVTSIPDGRGGVMILTNYPTTSANYPACGEHAGRLSLPLTAMHAEEND